MRKRKIPHTYVIVFYIIIIAALLTWIIPGGEYHEVTTGSGDSLTSSMEYRQTGSQPQTWQLFAAFYKGFVKQAGIIIFILLIGGAFWIMNSSRAIDMGIYSFLSFTGRLKQNRLMKHIGVENLIIVMIMVLFSLFGAIFGMSEETIAFVIIMVPLAISMGYDSITGVAMCFVAAGLGFAGAVLNPFTIGIAQGIAGLPLFSGLEYRMFCWLVINITGIGFVVRYATRIKKNPRLSPVWENDEYWRKRGSEETEGISSDVTPAAWISFAFLAAGITLFAIFNPLTTLSIGDPSEGSGGAVTLPLVPILAALFLTGGIITLRKTLWSYILHLLGFTILFLITGVMGYGWYIMEIATLFFAMGLFAGIAINKGGNDITKLFLEGAADIMPAALIVGLAGGIIVILEEGKIIGTILHSAASSMDNLGETPTMGVMYLIQTFINIFIPSGSAKAALTMPIMAPFSDLIGISRQATVMAFQFGDGFTNMITPTSGVLIGVLGVAKIPYNLWVKWITPLMVILIILGFLLLIPTISMDLNGF
jgi:uncharacterized ion transporter superfamily protein YfcC